MLCSLKDKVVILIAIGLSIATAGLISYLTFPVILRNQIKQRLILKEGSQSYKYWKDVPVPIYLRFYFFNLTNPEDVYDLKKPILEELGPYTFREERKKVNITWNENGTVSYRQIKRWYYQPDKSVGYLNDTITTLNVPMVAAATKGKEMNEDFVYFGMNIMFSRLGCNWIVRKTVDEFLFKGYNDTLLEFAKAFMDIPYDKFGWFYERNNTDDGEFVAFTGEENIDLLDEVYTWNNVESVSSYSPPCNMINGSAGDMWPPNLTDKDKPTIFVTDICRSLSFTFLKEVKIHGINTYRYWADQIQLDNGKYNPENKCFCSEDSCLPAGGVNVSTCKFDAPAVVSYPHFLFADPIYREGVIGMKPDPEKHRMYLDLIPEMGVPLGVAARMQINIVFDKVEQLTAFSNITRRTYFPMFWFSETAESGTDVTDQMKLPLVTIPLIANIVSFVLVSIGSFLVLSAFVLSILYASGKKEPAYSTVSSGISNSNQECVNKNFHS